MSGSKQSRVSTKIGDSVSDKILAMRTKIEDTSYMSNAVQIIALVLSRRIVEQPKTY